MAAIVIATGVGLSLATGLSVRRIRQGRERAARQRDRRAALEARWQAMQADKGTDRGRAARS